MNAASPGIAQPLVDDQLKGLLSFQGLASMMHACCCFFLIAKAIYNH